MLSKFFAYGSNAVNAKLTDLNKFVVPLRFRDINMW